MALQAIVLGKIRWLGGHSGRLHVDICLALGRGGFRILAEREAHALEFPSLVSRITLE